MALTDADFDEIFMDARERLIAWQKMYFSGRRAPYVQATNKALSQYAPYVQATNPPEQQQPPAEAPLPEQPATPAPEMPEDISNGMGLA